MVCLALSTCIQSEMFRKLRIFEGTCNYYMCSAQNNQNAMLGQFGRPFSVFDSTEQELYMWQD